MCSGGRLVADFVAGGCQQPCVPELADNLTTTVEGPWVVWAYKLARQSGDQFAPMSGRGSYPWDAEAQCLGGTRGPWPRRPLDRAASGHSAPEPSCTCGFHALSAPQWGPQLGAGLFGRRLLAPQPGSLPSEILCLTVVLTGRVLVFEWAGGGFLFRAARQTVVRAGFLPLPAVEREGSLYSQLRARRRPDDPEGHLARATAGPPSGTGPVHLALPAGCARVVVSDDAGWCQTDDRLEPAAPAPVPVLAGV
jgi:hypothetical protein